MRQVLVHILCCYWLPERPIGILVLIRDLLQEVSIKAWALIGCLNDLQELANRIGSVILHVVLLQYPN